MLKRCASCGGRLVGVTRTFWDRFRFQAIFRCKECGKRREEAQWYLFLLGPVSLCPHCGTTRLKRLTSVDHIDAMYGNPFSYCQKWFNANLHHCTYCRLQFYDYRPREADRAKTEAEAASVSSDPIEPA